MGLKIIFQGIILPQIRQGMMQAGLDGAQRLMRGSGDLLQRHLVNESQQQHFAMGVAEPGHCRIQRIAGFERCQGVGRRERRVEPGLSFAGCIRVMMLRLFPAFTQLCDRQMAGDGVEVCRQFRIGAQCEAGELFEQVKERLLHDVQRQFTIVDKSAGDGEHPLMMPAIELLKCLGPAAVARGDKIMIGLCCPVIDSHCTFPGLSGLNKAQRRWGVC